MCILRPPQQSVGPGLLRRTACNKFVVLRDAPEATSIDKTDKQDGSEREWHKKSIKMRDQFKGSRSFKPLEARGAQLLGIPKHKHRLVELLNISEAIRIKKGALVSCFADVRTL